MDKVLHASAAGKTAAVQGTFEGQEGMAIVALEKKPFDPDTLSTMLGPQAVLKLDFQNAEYGVCE